MNKLPRLTAHDVAVRLEGLGFRCVRQKGSHRRYQNPFGKKATVPFHGSRIISPKTLKSIIKEAGIEEW
jgi:predicted RNA binding protein YcfA (HicA-like mRNA interferase family)